MVNSSKSGVKPGGLGSGSGGVNVPPGGGGSGPFGTPAQIKKPMMLYPAPIIGGGINVFS